MHWTVVTLVCKSLDAWSCPSDHSLEIKKKKEKGTHTDQLSYFWGMVFQWRNPRHSTMRKNSIKFDQKAEIHR